MSTIPNIQTIKQTGGISVSDVDKEMKGWITFEQNNLQSTKLPKPYKNMKQKEIESKDEQNNWQLHKEPLLLICN